MSAAVQEFRFASARPGPRDYHIRVTAKQDKRSSGVIYKDSLSKSTSTFHATQKSTKPPVDGSMSEDTFINYTHPDQQHDKKNRRKIATYIGTHYRNRSRPSVRNFAESVTARAPTTSITDESSATIGKKSSHHVNHNQPFRATVHRDSYGLRDDPFTAYPIKATKCVSGAIDYFLEFYAPSHVIRPELVTVEDGPLLVKQYFRYALSHSLLFETIVALSQINLTSNQWVDRDVNSTSVANTQPDKEALFHYGQALKKLTNILGDETAVTEDAVLFAIATLMGVDYLINDLASFETHLGGLRRIIALRGGIDSLGWPTILKPLLNGLETIWSYMNSTPHVLATQATSIRQTTPPIPKPPLKPPPFPAVPFELPLSGWIIPPPTLTPDHTGWTKSVQPAAFFPCPASPTGVSMLSYLPVGFAVLALSTPPKFSLPVTTLLHRISTIDGLLNHNLPNARVTRHGKPLQKKYNNASNLQELEYTVRLLAYPSLSPLERVTCITILTILLDSTRSEQLSEVWIRQCQYHCEEILDFMNDSQLWARMDEDEKNCMVWAALDVAGMIVPPRVGSRGVWPREGGRGDKRLDLAVRVVKEYGDRGNGKGYEWVEEVGGRFFWTDGCMASWRNVWGLGEQWLEQEEADEIGLSNDVYQRL